MILINGEEIVFEEFPNEETRVVMPDLNLISKEINITFKYEEDGDLIKLMMVKRHLDTNYKKSVNIYLTIYYMPYSRMDREEGLSVFTLKYVSEFINNLRFDQVTVIEPHSDVTTALLNMSHGFMINEDLLPLVIEEVGFNRNEDYIFYPDAGAQKRYAKMYTGKQLVGYKHRDFQTGKITSFQVVGEGEGAHKAIIVDDLSSYGGTFLGAANALKERGFTEIYLLVAHAEKSVLHGNLLHEDSPITKVFTTNTIITEEDLTWTYAQYKDKIKIFDVEDYL